MALLLSNSHSAMTATVPAPPAPAQSSGELAIASSYVDLVRLQPTWLEFLAGGTIGDHVENDPRMIVDTARRRPDLQPLIHVVRRGGRIQCIAPLYLEKSRIALEFSVWNVASLWARKLCIWGDRLVFSRDADQRACVTEVLRGLRERIPPFDLLAITGLRQSDSLWVHGIEGGLFQQLAHLSPVLMRAEKNHQILMPPTFDDYLATLSKSTRKNLQRTSRRFFEGGYSTIEKISSPGDVDRLLKWLNEIHRNSWQGRTFGQRPWDDDGQRVLLRGVAENGWLRCYVLLRNDEPVAYEHGYLYNGTYFGLDCAYSQKWADAGPGSILIFSVIQDLAENERARIVDFGVGDLAYKRSFGNSDCDASTVFCAATNQWKRILRMQTMLHAAYDRLRNGLVRVGVDRLVRKAIKRQR